VAVRNLVEYTLYFLTKVVLCIITFILSWCITRRGEREYENMKERVYLGELRVGGKLKSRKPGDRCINRIHCQSVLNTGNELRLPHGKFVD
jgi:hypothetical protein